MSDNGFASDIIGDVAGAIHDDSDGARRATGRAGSGEHLDLIDNVLSDTKTPSQTRRWLLKRAAATGAAASALGLLDPVASAFARGGSAAAADSPQKIGVTAATAEAFAVTYLGAVLEKNRGNLPKNLHDVIAAAQLEEFRHLAFLQGAGFHPATKKFYLPNALFGSVGHVAAVIETAETLFINAYLIGITVFAQNGNPTVARYAGEILGVEAEHRALARSVQGKLPNNVAFEGFKHHRIDDVVKALEDAGVGFGKPTKKGGPVYHYHGIGNNSAGLVISNRRPS